MTREQLRTECIQVAADATAALKNKPLYEEPDMPPELRELFMMMSFSVSAFTRAVVRQYEVEL